jgi:hypothetical protein
MFHNPHSIAQIGGSVRSSHKSLSGSMASTGSIYGGSVHSASGQSNNNNMATPYHQRYPHTAQRAASMSYGNPSYTAPPAMTNSQYSRSHTEPLYQQDAVASSIGSPVVGRNYSYTGHNLNCSAGGGFGSPGGGYDVNAASAATAAASTTNYFASTSNASAGYSSSGSINNLTPPTSSNLTSNPYKVSSHKPSKCATFFKSILYLSLLSLAASTLYLRRAIQTASAQLEEAHHHAHKQHLLHVKKTGGRHGPRDNRRNSNQQSEIARLESSNADIQNQIDIKSLEYTNLEKQYEAQYGKLNGLENTKQNLLKAIEHETNLLENLEAEKEEHKAMLESKEKLDEFVNKREEALWRRVERLTERIGRESAREALDWYDCCCR